MLYPFAARVVLEYTANPFDQEAAFEYGLDLILDGLERSLWSGGQKPLAFDGAQ